MANLFIGKVNSVSSGVSSFSIATEVAARNA
jgi:hypothetical protein